VYCECKYDPDPDSFPEEDKPQQFPGESLGDFWDRVDQWARDIRQIVRPEPGTFVEPPNDTQMDLKDDFAEKGLQIIVKLANIHLTPDKPEYEGGTWHVEGQLVYIHHLFFRNLRLTSFGFPERTHMCHSSLLLRDI
jgi:hypothetical protein